jgi:hypothetical protein
LGLHFLEYILVIKRRGGIDMQAMSTIFPKVCLYAAKYTLFLAYTWTILLSKKITWTKVHVCVLGTILK